MLIYEPRKIILRTNTWFNLFYGFIFFIECGYELELILDITYIIQFRSNSYLWKRFTGPAVYRANLDLVWQHLRRRGHAEVGVDESKALVVFDLNQTRQLGE